MTQRTRADLLNQITTLLTDATNSGGITGADVRSVTTDIVDSAMLYEVGLFHPGAPANGATMARHVAPGGWSLPAGAAGQAWAGAAATAATTLVVQKNGTQIGTIDFAAAGQIGTVSIGAATSFAAGDRLSIQNAATADATLADVSVTLAGSRA